MSDKTMKVRIQVRVGESPEGGLTYTAAGWGTERGGHEDPSDVRETVDMLAEGDWLDGGRYSWVTADVPTPIADAEVTGTVEGVRPPSTPGDSSRRVLLAVDERLAISDLAQRIEAEDNAAHDLSTWLPAYKVAEENFGDHACEHMPSTAWVMRDAAEFIHALKCELGDERFEAVRERLAQKVRDEGWLEPEEDVDE